MRVVGLDTDMSVSGFHFTRFNSLTSLLDFDVAVWDPAATFASIASQALGTKHRGSPLLGEHASAELLRCFERRQEDMRRFVELGRTLVIYSCAMQSIWIQTPRANSRMSATLEECDLSIVLPFDYKATDAEGAAIAVSDPKFNAVVRVNRERWGYRAILEKFPGSPICVVAGTNHAVGSIAKFEGGGAVILLPDLHYLIDEIEDDSTEEVEREYEVDSDPVEVALIDWIRELRGGADADLPGWVPEWRFPAQVEREKQLDDMNERLNMILQQIETLRAADADEERWKILVAGSGLPLEAQVRRAFELLGFTVDESAPGRSDLRMKYGDRRAVVEVKGLGKSAAESNAAQLEKWVAEEIEEGNTPPKPILVVNAWRDRPPDKRGEQAFPDQMLKYAEARGHCLLTGLQLLAIVRAASKPAQAKKLASKILDNVGIFPGFDNPNELFVQAKRSESAAQAVNE